MLGELFDPKAELSIHEHYRPHWSQAGAIVFITFRTADSIPKEVLKRWEREKQEWIQRQGFDAREHWSNLLPKLTPELRNRFKKRFSRQREDFLDTCHGKCVLKRRDLAEIVSNSLLYFDGDRYTMGDFVVMPNHVHLLCAFPSEESLTTQCDSWLHYTATQINRKIGSHGKFWQQEPFDHLIRSPEQYEYLRRYIKDNGAKAKLPNDQYLYHQYQP